MIEETNGSKNFVSIPGLTYCKDGKVVTTKNENNSNLIDLPPIDWDLIDVKKCFRSFPHCNRMLYMYTSRGCPFKCAYCYNTMFYNSQHRKRPIGYVLDEILYLEKTYNLDGVNFSDELLLLSDEEINQISEFRKKNNLKFFWGGETRTDIYDLSQLKKMYEAGCRWLMLGIETGSETTRKQINKIMDQEQIKSFIDMCTQAGITTFGSFIIGFPDETPEQLKETAQFALSLGLDAFLFNYYVAIPKTPLGDKLIAAGKFTTEEVINQAAASSKLQCLTDNYSAISDKELLVVKSYFDWLTFTRKKKESAQKRMFIKKAFDVLKHSADGGFSRAFYNLFDAGKTFITVLYYSHAYPHIIRKYGLYNVNKK
ncbi:MAG: radical SAM protein [Clostridia bacterium]|nr:radical SAM protein [Clostridia bacterium]